ncbi:hypothetical protein Taro_011266 [Colocasia esculenta]|uniref:Uncharacterized protein n=1 Tax=Colocasia esculenta TaxID=4460 RepID=A0A843U9P2_COLES|nr:hypothetical protein [Colocasia esculenta]
MANKCLGCTIEAEPRTLTGGALISAREAAKGIAETKEVEEASTLFTEGMRPVVSIKTMEKQIERRDQLHNLVGINSTLTEAKQWTTLPGTPLVFEEFPDQTNIAESPSTSF